MALLQRRARRRFSVGQTDTANAVTPSTPAPTASAPVSLGKPQPIQATAFQPKLVLTADQKQLLKFMNDATLNRSEIEENLKTENKIGTRSVTFSEQEIRAILGSPSTYGLTNLV